MDSYRILVADPISERGIDALKADPALEVDVNIGLTEDELVPIVGQYHGLVIRSQTKVTPRVFEAATNLKVVGRAGVGVDNIDRAAADRAGVIVMNTPGGNTISTAEHAFTLMVSMSRHIAHAHPEVLAGNFKAARKKYQGVEVNGKTLAIIGMGRIGTEFARRARAFNMHVKAYDPYLAASRAKSLGVELCETVDSVIEDVDFITLHVPMTPETRHVINAARIAKMKHGVRIINCARGGLIDEFALLEGLKSGKVAGAALDVFEEEPPAGDYELINHPGVTVTPHLGASTAEAQENVGIEIAQQVRDALVDGSIVNSVNMPNVDQETLKEIGSYLDLAETLGRLVAQTVPNNPEFLRINYSGKVSGMDTALITRYAMKGFLEVSSGEEAVNHINAHAFAENLGLRVTESKLPEPIEFTDLIEVSCGRQGEMSSAAGTFFGAEPRIVNIRGRKLNVLPEGYLLFLENTDVPGIVGTVGTSLATHGVNIANMSLSRNKVGGQALMVLNLDSAVDEAALAGLEELEGITEARVISL